MYTGLICGLYYQFLYFLNDDIIKFQPVFDEKKFEGSFYLRGSIWTIYLLVIFLRFLVSTPIRKEIKLMRKKMGGAKYFGQFQYK